MASGVQSWDCAVKGHKEIYISEASVKNAPGTVSLHHRPAHVPYLTMVVTSSVGAAWAGQKRRGSTTESQVISVGTHST